MKSYYVFLLRISKKRPKRIVKYEFKEYMKPNKWVFSFSFAIIWILQCMACSFLFFIFFWPIVQCNLLDYTHDMYCKYIYFKTNTNFNISLITKKRRLDLYR